LAQNRLHSPVILTPVKALTASDWYRRISRWYAAVWWLVVACVSIVYRVSTFCTARANYYFITARIKQLSPPSLAIEKRGGTIELLCGSPWLTDARARNDETRTNWQAPPGNATGAHKCYFDLMTTILEARHSSDVPQTFEKYLKVRRCHEDTSGKYFVQIFFSRIYTFPRLQSAVLV